MHALQRYVPFGVTSRGTGGLGACTFTPAAARYLGSLFCCKLPCSLAWRQRHEFFLAVYVGGRPPTPLVLALSYCTKLSCFIKRPSVAQTCLVRYRYHHCSHTYPFQCCQDGQPALPMQASTCSAFERLRSPLGNQPAGSPHVADRLQAIPAVCHSTSSPSLGDLGITTCDQPVFLPIVLETLQPL